MSSPSVLNASSSILDTFTGGYALSDLPSCYSLYITLGLCVFFLILIIACAVIDNKEESPLGNIKTDYPQIAPTELPQAVPTPQSHENYAQAVQEQNQGSDNRSDDIEDIVVAPQKEINQAQVEIAMRVAPLPLQSIVRSESIKLKGAGAKFLIFHNYISPFTKIPDSISRTKKSLLLFLRIMCIYMLNGLFYTNPLLSVYLALIKTMLPYVYVVYAIFAAVSVIFTGMLLYFVNFFVVVPSRERIIIQMQRRGAPITEAIATASAKVATAKCCNIFGIILIVLMLLCVILMCFVMPSNFVELTRVDWMVTFGFAIGEDILFFQLTKVFFLLCFIGCCGGSKDKPASNCGVCWNSFIAGKIVYI